MNRPNPSRPPYLQDRPDRPLVKNGRRQQPIWVTATGRFPTRVDKARFYLKHTAWVPTATKDRRTAIKIVACNLRLYHRLPIRLSVEMVLKHFVPRCKSNAGVSITWTPEDVRGALHRADARGMFPTLGVSDPKARQKVIVRDLFIRVKNFIQRHTSEGGHCTPLDLRTAFIAFCGGASVTATAFGRAVASVTGLRTITPFGKRIYRGFHILETGSGVSKRTMVAGVAA